MICYANKKNSKLTIIVIKLIFINLNQLFNEAGVNVVEKSILVYFWFAAEEEVLEVYDMSHEGKEQQIIYYRHRTNIYQTEPTAQRSWSKRCAERHYSLTTASNRLVGKSFRSGHKYIRSKNRDLLHVLSKQGNGDASFVSKNTPLMFRARKVGRYLGIRFEYTIRCVSMGNSSTIHQMNSSKMTPKCTTKYNYNSYPSCSPKSSNVYQSDGDRFGYRCSGNSGMNNH